MAATAPLTLNPNKTTAQAMTAQGVAPAPNTLAQPQQTVRAPATMASKPINQGSSQSVQVATSNPSTQPLIAKPIENMPTFSFNNNTMTVEGRLNALLKQSNPYIQQAQQAAKEEAAKRGLMNSSMAVQSGEQAAISQALPIAQQDAQTLFNKSSSEYQMGGQFGLQSNQFKQEKSQAELQNSFAQSQLELQHSLDADMAKTQQGYAKEMANLNFTNQSTLQDKELSAQEKLAIKGFDNQASLQEKQLSAQEKLTLMGFENQAALQGNEIASQKDLANLNYANQGLLQDKELSAQEKLANLNYSNQSSLQKEQIASQEKLAALSASNDQTMAKLQASLNKDLQLSLQGNQLSNDLTKMQKEIDANAETVNKQLSSQMQMHYAESQRTNLTNFASEVQSIQSSDMSAADKTAAIKDTQARYEESSKYLGGLYLGVQAGGVADPIGGDISIWKPTPVVVQSPVVAPPVNTLPVTAPPTSTLIGPQTANRWGGGGHNADRN